MEKHKDRIGTALCANATRVMLLGCGELGKEVALELQRLGVEVIAVDRYANAPAMQVAQRYVIDMLMKGRCVVDRPAAARLNRAGNQRLRHRISRT